MKISYEDKLLEIIKAFGESGILENVIIIGSWATYFYVQIFDALKNKINYDSILELLQQNNLYDCMTNRISLEDDFYWVQFVNINNELDENNKLLYTYSDLIKHSDI